MALTRIADEVVAGSTFAFAFTLQKDGVQYPSADITGATVTCSIRQRGSSTPILTAVVLTFVAATAVATLSLTAAQTVLLVGGADGIMRSTFVGDVKVVETGGTVVYCGPFEFLTRSAIT